MFLTHLLTVRTRADCIKVLPHIPISLIVPHAEGGVAKLMLVPNLYLSQVNNIGFIHCHGNTDKFEFEQTSCM